MATPDTPPAEGAADTRAKSVNRGDPRADAPPDSERALVYKLEKRVEPPDDIRAEMDKWESDRKYIHTDAMLLDEEDAVGTNFLLRNQYAQMALLFPQDPAPRLQPRRWLPGQESEGQPVTYPEDVLRYGQTHEVLIDYQQNKAGLREILAGAAQDALTLPVSWLKMKVQEDYTLDALGYGRNNDQVDLIKRYERYRRQLDTGEITTNSAEYDELLLLNRTIRAYILDDLKAKAMEELGQEEGDIDTHDGDEPEDGFKLLNKYDQRVKELEEDPDLLIELSDLPEVAHYTGYTFQQVDPEDIRWDWNIRRPEDMRYVRWMAHRAFMTPSDISEKWSIDVEDLHEATRFRADGTKLVMSTSWESDPEYGGKDPEERDRGPQNTARDMDVAQRGTLLAVWEYWDRVQGRVMRWVQGTSSFLDRFVPEALPSRFYPFYPIMYNRVTGKTYGPSDTDLQRPLQDESNRLRTWNAEAQKSGHPRYLVAKGLLKPGEKQRMAEALPYDIIEAERADEVSRSIHEIIPPSYDPRLYDRFPALTEMSQMAGLPTAATGAPMQGVTATGDAIANEQFGNQMSRREDTITTCLRDIYTSMAEINAQIMEEPAVTQIVGPGAVWLPFNRQQVLSNFIVEVDAVLNDATARAAELKAWLDISQIGAQMGLPLEPVAITKKLLELMGVRDNIGRYISVPQMLQGQMGPGAGGAPPADPTASPDAQGAMGAMGGGAPMTAPPAPESVPNSPA